MDTGLRITKVIAATPSQLEKIDAILENNASSIEANTTRLLTFSNAATQLGVSRQTVWRMITDGRLPTVEIRQGRRRIPSSALTALVKRVEFKGGQA